MKRFILLLQPQFTGALKLKIVLGPLQELEFHYSLYKITENLPNSIRKSLMDNPLASNVFDSIGSKQLLVHHKLLLGQATSIYTDTLRLLEQHKGTTKYICIQMPSIGNLYLKYDQLLILSGFLNNFVNSYDIIKINLMQNNKASIEQTVEDKVFSNIQPPPQNEDFDILKIVNLDQKSEHEPENNTKEIKTTIGRQIVQEIMKTVSNNPKMALYISKLVFNELESGNIIDKLSDVFDREEYKGKTVIAFKFSPLLTNDSIFSKAHSEELISVLETIVVTRDEGLGKLHMLCKYFKYLLKTYILSEDKGGLTESEVIDHIILPLKILQFIIFLFSFKISTKVNYNFIKPNTIGRLINILSTQTINFINQKYGLEFNYLIKFKNSKQPLQIGSSYHDALYEALTKYEYLLSVNTESFINHVFDEVKINLPEITNPNKCLCDQSAKNIIKDLVINQPKYIDINKILETNKDLEYDQISPSLFKYKNLVNDNKYVTPTLKYDLNSKFIITQEYLHILQLSSVPTIGLIDDKIIQLNDVHPIVLKYADVIINNMIRDLIDDNVVMDCGIISTLYLLDNIILPNMPNDNYTIDTVLFIIYRILIPACVDMFNVFQVQDFFH